MGNPLTSEQLKELVFVTSEKLGIKHPAIVEKDYYVTQIIHLLAGIENKYFRLVFGGGTCLAKAHKIIKRMSEDVDFKIQCKNTDILSNRSQLRKELTAFRSQIRSLLLSLDLATGKEKVENEGQHLSIELKLSCSISNQ